MTKKIIAFGASNSKNSINKKLAEYTADQINGVEITVLDLNNFELPIYSIDLERETGVPANAIRFSQFIQEADGVIISLAEYNGLYTSAFKNLWDWMSRMGNPKIWHNKPMFLIGTSPSRREGSYVMKVSKYLFPLFGANIISSFHLPSFNHFFRDGQIVEPKQIELFDAALEKFQTHLINN
ncbi:NADPH-dependent FMN reductase [Ulvibacterium sp.]|uniref:NADPH-dependent FMN reductase n=1 Tax=Ulvibacterium sp. TaxID=2665914 RepID=UPI003CC5CB5A